MGGARREQSTAQHPAARGWARHRRLAKQKGQLHAHVTRCPKQGTQLQTAGMAASLHQPQPRVHRCPALRAVGQRVELTLSPRGMCGVWPGRVSFLKAKGLQQMARAGSSKAGCDGPVGRSRARQLHLGWALVLQWLLGEPVRVSYQRSAGGELSPTAKPSSGSVLLCSRLPRGVLARWNSGAAPGAGGGVYGYKGSQPSRLMHLHEEAEGIFPASAVSPFSLASCSKGTMAFHAALDLRASSKPLLAGP